MKYHYEEDKCLYPKTQSNRTLKCSIPEAFGKYFSASLIAFYTCCAIKNSLHLFLLQKTKEIPSPNTLLAGNCSEIFLSFLKHTEIISTINILKRAVVHDSVSGIQLEQQTCELPEFETNFKYNTKTILVIRKDTVKCPLSQCNSYKIPELI